MTRFILATAVALFVGSLTTLALEKDSPYPYLFGGLFGCALFAGIMSPRKASVPEPEPEAPKSEGEERLQSFIASRE